MKDSNKLIAEFMGYKKIEDYYLLPINLSQFQNSDHGEWCSQYEVSFSERYWEIAEDNLNYHTSWDWLMPVVEEIDHLQFEEVVEIETGLKMRSLSATYNAVVEFIKQQNKNK